MVVAAAVVALVVALVAVLVVVVVVVVMVVVVDTIRACPARALRTLTRQSPDIKKHTLCARVSTIAIGTLIECADVVRRVVNP